jgi:hypothetical protein
MNVQNLSGKYQSPPTQVYPSGRRGQKRGRSLETSHLPAQYHIPGDKRVCTDKTEKSISWKNLVITALCRLFKGANGVEVRADNRFEFEEV